MPAKADDASTPNGKTIGFGFRPTASSDSNATISGSTIYVPSSDVANRDVTVTIGGFFDESTPSYYTFQGYQNRIISSSESITGVDNSYLSMVSLGESHTEWLNDGSTVTTTNSLLTCFGKLAKNKKGNYIYSTNSMGAAGQVDGNKFTVLGTGTARNTINLPEYPLYTVQYKIPAGTPDGTYNIAIDNDYKINGGDRNGNPIEYDGNMIFDADGGHNYNVNYSKATIVVGSGYDTTWSIENVSANPGDTVEQEIQVSNDRGGIEAYVIYLKLEDAEKDIINIDSIYLTDKYGNQSPYSSGSYNTNKIGRAHV